MKLLLAILLLIVISVLGSRITFLNRRFFLGFRSLLLTGTEYVFIGVLLGGMGFNILDLDALKKMEPFLIFGLCWIGFLFGLQFKVRMLKNLPRFYFSISAVQAILTFLLVTLALFFLFKKFAVVPQSVLLLAAITMGSTASCTAQSALAIVSHNYKFKNRRLLDLMRYISGIDGFYALCFFAVALSIFPEGEIGEFNLYRSVVWLLISCVMGIIPALIFISLSRIRFSKQEFLLFLIGTVTFCGGLAFQMHYSPLVSGFLCGIFIANFCRHRLRALSEVLHAEKTIYIILLILLGAAWNLKMDFILVIAGIYIIIRAFGKFFGTFMGIRLFKPGYHVPPTVGLGLISDGGFTVAIIMNFMLIYPSFANPLLTIVVLSLIVNELFSPWLILSQFDKKDWMIVDVREKYKKITQKR